ncbi:MAG: macro domain-containing protein, partial [Bacteroidota bacterium]
LEFSQRLTFNHDTIMINYVTGNIFESQAEALVNTVNTVGVMGKGIALQFKKAYPNNFKAYAKACKKGEVRIGKLFIFRDSNIETGEKLIINFPTKKHWKNSSEYAYVAKGLMDLVRIISENNLKHVAIPPLGAGNGGLHWERVKEMIVEQLAPIDVKIDLYEPNSEIKEKLKKERVKLTSARALLLYVLFDLVRNGEYVSEFSSEKVCYFLQKFGAAKYFKLAFHPQFYGPYSGKVRYLLNTLNGSYIMGYSGMDKKPFDPLLLISDGFEEVKKVVETNEELKTIATSTTEFLNGFYSDFSLELLSSVHFLSAQYDTLDETVILAKLSEWNDRKRSLFSDRRYLSIAVKHLQQFKDQMT